MTAYLIVRATVPEGEEQAFDRWYESEHLPDVKAAFHPMSAERGWCVGEPAIHFALYRFATVAEIQGLLQSEVTMRLMALFDGRWEGRVTRTREVFEVRQTL